VFNCNRDSARTGAYSGGPSFTPLAGGSCGRRRPFRQGAFSRILDDSERIRKPASQGLRLMAGVGERDDVLPVGSVLPSSNRVSEPGRFRIV
jgi:hypothetical protein